MHTPVILIIAVIITLFSLLLKFINIAKENVSIFRAVQNKKDEVAQKIEELKIEGTEMPRIKHFRLAISDWFSALAIVLVSFRLIMEYVSNEPLTRATVVYIGLLFSLFLFNLIFISISTIERRLGYWIDEFMVLIGYLSGHIQKEEKKARTMPAGKKRKSVRPKRK